MNRLDCFNVAASLVLARLLASFPQPVVLDAQALQAEVVSAHGECEIQGTPGNPGSLLIWTIQFLVDEGYVRPTGADEVRPGMRVVRCTLSAKGFAALNRKLKALTPEQTLGGCLLEVGKLAAPEVARTMISRLLE